MFALLCDESFRWNKTDSNTNFYLVLCAEFLKKCPKEKEVFGMKLVVKKSSGGKM